MQPLQILAQIQQRPRQLGILAVPVAVHDEQVRPEPLAGRARLDPGQIDPAPAEML